MDSVKGGQPLAGTLFPVALQTLGSLPPPDSPAVYLPAPPAKPRNRRRPSQQGIADGSGRGTSAAGSGSGPSRVPAKLKHPVGPRPGIVVLTPTATPNPSPEKPPRLAAPRALTSPTVADVKTLNGAASEGAAEAQYRNGAQGRALDFGDAVREPSDAGGTQEAASSEPASEATFTTRFRHQESTGRGENSEASPLEPGSFTGLSGDPATCRVPSEEAEVSIAASSSDLEYGSAACEDARLESRSREPCSPVAATEDAGWLAEPECGVWEYPAPQGFGSQVFVGSGAREGQQADSLPALESEARLRALISEHASALQSLNSGSNCSIM